MSRQWSYLILCLLAVTLRVAGQTSNVTTCVSDYAWSINTQKQTPCLVAAYLETLCGVPTSVDAIPVGTHYLGPSTIQQDPCKCSSVTYSAVSACGGCQGRTFQNWTTWSMNCASVETASFPKIIPTEVVVPIWMYINVTLIGNNFDPILAQQVLDGSPVPTSSIPVSTLTTSSLSSTSSSPTNSPTQMPQAAVEGSSKKSNAGAIAGGVIGGLVVIAIIGLLVLWSVMRKRRNAVQTDFSFDSRALVSGPPVSQQVTGSTGITYSSPDGPSPIPYGGQSVYETFRSQAPSEHHGAYPLSPTTSSAMFTSPPPGRRSLESVSPSMVQLGGYQTQMPQPQGYRGAAELS